MHSTTTQHLCHKIRSDDIQVNKISRQSKYTSEKRMKSFFFLSLSVCVFHFSFSRLCLQWILKYRNGVVEYLHNYILDKTSKHCPFFRIKPRKKAIYVLLHYGHLLDSCIYFFSYFLSRVYSSKADHLDKMYSRQFFWNGFGQDFQSITTFFLFCLFAIVVVVN